LLGLLLLLLLLLLHLVLLLQLLLLQPMLLLLLLLICLCFTMHLTLQALLFHNVFFVFNRRGHGKCRIRDVRKWFQVEGIKHRNFAICLEACAIA
jgi:hypothetical protein